MAMCTKGGCVTQAATGAILCPVHLREAKAAGQPTPAPAAAARPAPAAAPAPAAPASRLVFREAPPGRSAPSAGLPPDIERHLAEVDAHPGLWALVTTRKVPSGSSAKRLRGMGYLVAWRKGADGQHNLWLSRPKTGGS